MVELVLRTGQCFLSKYNVALVGLLNFRNIALVQMFTCKYADSFEPGSTQVAPPTTNTTEGLNISKFIMSLICNVNQMHYAGKEWSWCQAK
jgi:hypothetical protein